jgi:hypothetical protein
VLALYMHLRKNLQKAYSSHEGTPGEGKIRRD